MHRTFLVIAAVALAASVVLTGCDDDDSPVDIPFAGKEVKPGATEKKVAPKPPPVSPATAPKAQPKRHSGKASGIAGCCSALSAASRNATSAGDKANYKAAASVCYSKSSAVQRGKLTRSQALSQVRASLLLAAPAACR